MVEKPIYIQKELNFKKPAPDAVLDVITASGLLPADYCQLERPFYLQRTQTELVWKSDMWFGDKALVLRATVADVIHYCQLGKLAVQRDTNDARTIFFLYSKYRVLHKKLSHLSGAKPGAKSRAKGPK